MVGVVFGDAVQILTHSLIKSSLDERTRGRPVG